MNIEVAAQQALATRRELQAEARAIGVSESYISLLVDAFYDKVQIHPELGPVFNDVIQNNWPVHLQRMKLFWNSIALRTSEYQGNPLPKHKALTEAKPEHFTIWLSLFRETLSETAPSPEVVDYFMGFADAMAARLSKAMFS